MPQSDSIIRVGSEIVRFKSTKLGVAVYRQRYTHKGENAYTKSFYVNKTVGGKTVRFPLGLDARAAEKLAEEITAFLTIPTNTLEMAVAKYDPRKADRIGVPSFTMILKTFESALNIIGRKGGRVSSSTFKGYRSFLATMLRKVEAHRKGKPFESFFGKHHIDYSPWFDQPIDILDTRFAMDFKLASIPPPPDGEDEADEEELLTAKISADTALRNARALFSKQAMRYYKQCGLIIPPSITGFMEEPDFGAKKYFQLLPPNIIVNVVRASIALRIDDLDAFRGYLLCMHCGLRRGEALAFHPSWIRREDRPMLYVTVKGRFNPKHGTGRKVAIEQWVADTLQELGPISNEQALDRLNEWVKALIPTEFTVSKPLHELRKCWVSAKAKTEGLLAAQQQAGHRDSETTTRHYADNLMPDWLVPLWRESAETSTAKLA